MSRTVKREGAAVGSAASPSDYEIARLQSEWERVRGQRLALEKKQERARNGHEREPGNTTVEPIDVADEEEDAEDAMLVALQTEPSTDPFACCCHPLKLKKLGQNYVRLLWSILEHIHILHERRVVDRGRVTRELILVGPHWVGVLVTLSIIVGSTGLFLHQQCTLLPWYYSVITLGFCAMTLYYLYGVACKDPGIVLPRTKSTGNIPREDATTIVVSDDNEQDNNGGEETNGNSGDMEVVSARARRSPPPPLQPQSHAYARFSPRARFCDICEVHQDAYTEHCDDCGVCIEDLDHHCPWMGKCIGKRNMHAFRMFNVSWVFYVIFVLFVSIQNVDWSDVAVQKLHRLSTGEWVPVPQGTTEKAH